MLSIKKKISIAVSLLAFCTGSFDAFGTNINDKDNDNEKQGKTLVISKPQGADPSIINNLITDIMKLFYTEASKVTNPLYLTSVCKMWFHAIHEGKDPELGLRLSGFNPFLKHSMKLWWSHEGSVTSLGQFYNGQLIYKLGTPDEKIIHFSSLVDAFKETIDLSDFAATGKYLVITTDEERLREIEGRNKDKTVIAILMRQQVEYECKKDPNHPLGRFLKDWNKNATVGIFYKWGNADLSCTTYLTTATLSEISLQNLFQNWGDAVRIRRGGFAEAAEDTENYGSLFHVYFQNDERPKYNKKNKLNS